MALIPFANGLKTAFAGVAASATDSNLVTAVSGKSIQVYGVIINQGDTTPSTVVFNSKGSGAGTAISATLKAAANGGFVIDQADFPWFATLAGEGLTVSTGAGSTTNIHVVYREKS